MCSQWVANPLSRDEADGCERTVHDRRTAILVETRQGAGDRSHLDVDDDDDDVDDELPLMLSLSFFSSAAF